ncbi:type III restriction enzyme [Nocardioides sp. YR527]|uniref:DEAD/DEAH box helicase n=1 Tax=Nocardioides sp. YR527 TaxID=1881028 RepID=UPI000880A18C|nr:DEAD/DEAH box helicase family protein [Nocardioides sp. YR527]SDJ99660.1 type III restriction enzyme [Nocardioides sp. YR527]
MSIPYDVGLVEQISHTLDLRAPNQAALDRLAEVLDVAVPGQEMVADLATGVGKTYIAGGALDYLYESGVRNVVIVTPGSTIQKKTIDNLTPGHRKYLRGLQCNPMIITLDTIERGQVAAALEDENRFKVFVFTVQSLLGAGKGGKEAQRRAHRPHETLGQAVYDYLTAADDLVVIADEHHIYYSGSAKKFQSAIDDLKPAAMIGLTATPHPSTPAEKIVFRYRLSEAIADGYVKIPVLVSRKDGIKDARTQVADGLTLLDAKAEAMRAYCRQTRKTYVEPILFVVTQTIDEANEYRDLLSGTDMLGDPAKVLSVNSEETEETLRLLDTIEDPKSPIRAVVSVNMLNEGWDVKNIYVVASTRALESDLLSEQILGRGLRLPFGERTGNPMLDTVEVLSHNSFAALLKRARALLEETLGERASGATIAVNPQAGKQVPGVPLTASGDLPEVALPTSGEVQIWLPGPAATDPDQMGLFEPDEANATDSTQTHLGMSLATLGSRVATAEQSTQILTRTLHPRMPGKLRIPMFLPRVTTRWERDPFTLNSIDLTEVELLGRKFAEDEAPTFVLKQIDAERDDEGRARVVISDATYSVAASQVAIPYGDIETDLVQRLLRTDGILMNSVEKNAALAIARAFMAGADVTVDTPWRAEHGRLATARLAEWINSKQTSSPAREVKEVTHVKWPEPPTVIETRPPADRHVITSSAEFTRSYPYEGWAKSVYEINTFDAYSTEFRLASLFEAPGDVTAWIRINETVPLRIPYHLSAIQRQYEPDFIVVDIQGTYWIVEGKADSEMTSNTVIAKRDAAREWVKTVNASDSVHHQWAYLLASESVIASAATWAALKNGGQAFQ